jgi:peptidoglycan hydrolase-like protein with peptidoglycan-binding domain
MNHIHAKEITDALELELGLEPAEGLAVRLVGLHETHYGDGWGDDPAKGAGSNNWGANTTTSTDPASTFEHADSRFDPATGQVVKYSTHFPRYATPALGARGLALVLLFNNSDPKKGRRENVQAATRNRSVVELATAMRLNRYYLGTKPLAQSIDDYTRALQTAWAAIKADTHETLYDVPLVDSPTASGEASGYSPVSSSSHSARPFLAALSQSLPVLRRSNRGDLVGVLQFELGLSPDEIFGQKTEQAVRAFQSTHGLEVSGVVSSSMWALLFGSESSDVG